MSIANTLIEISNESLLNFAEKESLRLIAKQVKAKNKRIKELEELLIEYGRHSSGCSAQYDKKYPCRCGWDREKKQALKG